MMELFCALAVTLLLLLGSLALLGLRGWTPAEEPGFWRGLLEDAQNILRRDPAAGSLPEVLLCYPGLHARALHRVAHPLRRRGWVLLARLVSQFARFWTGVEIHPGAVIGRRLFIDHGMGVVIGETAEIGDDVILFHGVTLGGTSMHRGKRHPTLGHGVVVGAGAMVLGGFAVGDGALIGANAVVTRAVPAGATYAGIPARSLDMLAGEAAARQGLSSESSLETLGELRRSFGVARSLFPAQVKGVAGARAEKLVACDPDLPIAGVEAEAREEELSNE